MIPHNLKYFAVCVLMPNSIPQILRKPLFAGDSEIDQLFRIFRVMGTPTETTWPGVTQLPDFRASFPNWTPQMMPIPNAIMNNAEEELPDLFMVSTTLIIIFTSHTQLSLKQFVSVYVQKIMVLDPHRRISAKNAMLHPYFDNIEIVKSVQLPLDTP